MSRWKSGFFMAVYNVSRNLNFEVSDLLLGDVSNDVKLYLREFLLISAPRCFLF